MPGASSLSWTRIHLVASPIGRSLCASRLSNKAPGLGKRPLLPSIVAAP